MQGPKTLKSQICATCGTALGEENAVCAACQAGITGSPQSKDEDPDRDDEGDGDLLRLMSSSPSKGIQNNFQTGCVRYGIIIGVLVGLLGFVVGVVGSDPDMAFCGPMCGFFSAILGLLPFGAGGVIAG